MPTRQVAGLACDASQSEFGVILLLSVFRQRHGLEGAPRLGREPCAGEQAGPERLVRMDRVQSGRLPRGALGLYVVERVLWHRVQRDARDRDLQYALLIEEQVALSPGTVPRLEVPAHSLGRLEK